MPAFVQGAVAFLKWVWAAKTLTAAAIKFAATVAASYAIGRALQPKLKSTLTTNNPLELTRDPLTPRRIAYGNTRIGGAIRFHYETGANNNQYLYLIILWAAHPVHAIDEIWFNDELVPLDGSGNATGTYAGLVRCTHHLGAWDQAADANFVSELGGTIWSSTDRWQGNAYSAIRLKQDQSKFPGGLPAITAKGRWRIPYDPRDEAQDPDDPSTWVYTNNADVCFYDYLRGVPIKIGDGSIARLMGVNAEDDEIVQDAAIAAMNECDIDMPRATGFTLDCAVLAGNRHINTADVSGILTGMPVSGGVLAAGTMVVSVDTGGVFFTVDRDPTGTDASVDLVFGDTEKKYTANGCFDLDAVPSTVVDHFLSATGGKLHDVGGDLVMRAGAWEEPDVDFDTSTLRDGGIVVTAPLSWREKLNYVKGTFQDPAENFQKNDFPPVISDAMIDADGAELPADLDLSGFVTSPAQAQRIAKMKLLRTRQGIVATKSCTLEAATAVTGENYRFSDDGLGWSDKEFELLEFTLRLDRDKNGRSGFVIDITGQETAASIFDWDTDEEVALDPSPNTTLADPRNVNAPTSLGRVNDPRLQQDGTTTPAVKLFWTAPNDQAVISAGTIEVQYKESAASDWLNAQPVPGAQTQTYLTNVQSGVNYDFRIRAVNNYRVPSAYVTPAAGALLVLGDTSAPSAPTLLSVVAKAGYNEVKWTKSNSPDAASNAIWRNTTNNSSTATRLGEVDAEFFKDSTATPGTQYWYWVAPIDLSRNESATRTAAGNVTTAAAPLGDVTPSDPTAATKTSQGIRLGGDGTAYAYFEMSVPALPTNATWQNLLVRVNVAGSFEVAAQLDNTSSATVRIEGLIPGQSYQVATQAWAAGRSSNVVQATSAPFTAPADSTIPNNPTSLNLIAGDATGQVRPPPVIRNGSLMYACVLTFVESTSSDLDFYEVGVNLSNTIDPSINVDVDGSQFPCPKGARLCYIYRPAAVTEYLWIRAVDYSGNRSSFVLVGDISSYLKLPAGNALERNVGTSSGTVAAGDDSRVTGAAQKSSNLSDLGSASTARDNLGLGSIATQSASSVSITGGSITGMTALGTTSTRRRKKNIRTIKDPLAIVRALRGVRFDSKDGKVKGDVGLIAEEVAPILPTLVTYDEHGKINGISYGQLGGVLVGAIQQLEARSRRRRRRKKRKD